MTESNKSNIQLKQSTPLRKRVLQGATVAALLIILFLIAWRETKSRQSPVDSFAPWFWYRQSVP